MSVSSLQLKEASSPATESPFKRAANLLEQGQPEKAAHIYKKLLRAAPDNAACWLNLGMTLRQMGHLNASLVCSKRALELSPGKPAYLTNYGNCFASLDRKDESLQAHASAAKAHPDDFLIRKNYAIALRDFGHYEAALVHFNAACSMKPDDINLQWDRALTYLYMGQFKKGWEAFEIRWQLGKLKKRALNAPKWQGEDLKGKTILIYEEQGFGDTILCSRYLPMVAARGGQIIFECKRNLHRLFQSIPGVEKIVEPSQFEGHVDYHIPMMSLPGIFETDLQSIPPAANLHVAPSLPAEIEKLLSFGKGRFKVGIVWSGSVTFGQNSKRAASIERFLALAGIPGVQLYSLQKGPCEKDLAACGADGLILELGPHLNDFADTAGVLKELDLVIMTDSSVAHLAGSLGVPVWNLLGSRPYWLYLSEREDSPWYPSMRLFRQPEPGDWDNVFKTVATELEKAASYHATFTSLKKRA
jgi:hypothetical protein